MDIKRIRIVSLICLVGLISGPLLYGQDSSSSYLNKLVLNDQQYEAGSGSSLLEQNIDLDFEEASIEEALVEIARQADLKLMYSENALPANKKLTLHSRTSLYNALWSVLEGSGLQFAVSQNSQLIIFPMEEDIAEQVFQDGILTGRVVDVENGEELPGANVFIEELGQGTSTDINGEFTISNIENGTYTVKVTYVGFLEHTQEVVIEDETSIDFELQLSASELSEVVVTGYGVHRTKPTGAISTISGDDFKTRSIQTPDQALQGRASGFRMVSTSGAPGGASYIRIRGMGSINAETDPLFIIDGTRIESSYSGTMGSNNILQGLNPADIQDMTVLKDAEATALYGAEGSNGVVLITTRKGKEGPTQFSASAKFGSRQQDFRYDLMSGPDFVTAMQEATVNRALDLGEDPEAARQEAIDTYGHPDEVGTYDWYGSMIQPGFSQTYNLSARGGSESTQFFVSGGFNDEQGTFIGSEFDRMSLLSNITHKASDKLRFDLNTNISRRKATGIMDHDGSTGGSNWIGSPFHGGVTTRVTSPIYNEDGSYNQDPGDLSGVMYNNVQVLNEEKQWSRTMQIIGNISATYSFSDNLSFRSRWALDYKDVLDHRFYNPSIDRYNAYGGAVYERNRETTSWNTDQVLDYMNTFDGVHNVNAILGAEYQHMYRRYMTAHTRGLPSSLFSTISSGAENYTAAGSFGEYKNAGVFSRGEYNYDNRYYAAVNLRYDGSSRFGEDRRYGLFYSGSLAWDLAAEDFMSDLDMITELKPRISHGTSGNSKIGYYAARPFFETGGSYGGETGLRPTQLGNATLTWEEALSTDIGVDFSLYEGRAYGTVAVFRKDNKNLLLDRNLPTNSGFSSISDNVGTVRVEGLELELGAVVLQSGKFSWRSDFNLTYERSEILELSEGQETIGNEIRVGEQRQIRWGAEFAGVNPSNGQPMWYDENNELTYQVTDADRRVIGSQLPDYYGGFNNTFNYGAFSMNVLFHYEYGKDLYNYQHDVFMLTAHRGRTLANAVWDRWQEPGDMTVIPRMYSTASFPGGSSVSTFDTRNMEDGSFIRLKNLTLQYQVPQRFLEGLNLSSVSLFVQGENLLTWTKFKGPDPEVIAQTQTNYPIPRTFTGGINIDF